MTLEDHLGDILGKAREAANVSAAAAAKAAAISEEEWKLLEDSGRIDSAFNFSAVGPLLKLSVAKLEQIAKGWLPRAHDLSLWRELRLITTTREGITVNCYLVWDEISREG